MSIMGYSVLSETLNTFTVSCELTPAAGPSLEAAT